MISIKKYLKIFSLTKQFYFLLFLNSILNIFKFGEIKKDYERYPQLCNSSKKESEIKILVFKLLKIKKFVNNFINNNNFRKDWEGISEIYKLFIDKYSKKKFIELMLARMIGYEYVKLVLNNNVYWNIREKIKNLIEGNDIINYGIWKLNFFNLNKVNIPLKLFSITLDIMCTFFLEQYCYKHEQLIDVEDGDYVIDAGGCWGDNALCFANKVGTKGKVFSFEFVPNNVKIMDKNITLNPHLSKIIEIIRNPIWNISDFDLYFIDKGPSSFITDKDMKKVVNKVKSITIDDFVKKNSISKIDFIKIDIEGAELKALIGAKRVLSEFKPKLAISVYHSYKDIYKIPNFLSSLNLDYNFYFDHFTTYSEESILFAKVNDLKKKDKSVKIL